MKTIKPGKNMTEQSINSSELFAAVCNKEIGTKEAKRAVRILELNLKQNMAKFRYNEKHHPNRKIKFMEE